MAEYETNLRLMMSIVHHLREELLSRHFNEEQQKGVNLAINCLQKAYDCQNTAQNELPLLEIYQCYLTTTTLDKVLPSSQDKANADKLKIEGNCKMREAKFSEAIKLYTRAIQLDPTNSAYYCNRAAAHSKLQNHHQAIADGKTAIEIDPTYSKAHATLGLVYSYLEDYPNSLEHYAKALALEPNNERYKNSHELAKFILNQTESSPVVSTRTSIYNTPDSPPPSVQPDLECLLRDPMFLNIAAQLLMDPNQQAAVEPQSAGFLDVVNGNPLNLLMGNQIHQTHADIQFMEELRNALRIPKGAIPSESRNNFLP